MRVFKHGQQNLDGSREEYELDFFWVDCPFKQSLYTTDSALASVAPCFPFPITSALTGSLNSPKNKHFGANVLS